MLCCAVPGLFGSSLPIRDKKKLEGLVLGVALGRTCCEWCGGGLLHFAVCWRHRGSGDQPGLGEHLKMDQYLLKVCLGSQVEIDRDIVRLDCTAKASK